LKVIGSRNCTAKRNVIDQLEGFGIGFCLFGLLLTLPRLNHARHQVWNVPDQNFVLFAIVSSTGLEQTGARKNLHRLPAISKIL
jgi:hypothetical protein